MCGPVTRIGRKEGCDSKGREKARKAERKAEKAKISRVVMRMQIEADAKEQRRWLVDKLVLRAEYEEAGMH